MAIKITATEEKPLTARKEIKASASFHGKATPSNAEIAKHLASELKVDEKLVVVKHVYTSFGSADASVEAYVYNTEDDLKRFEPVTKAMKQKEEAAKKKAEAPAEGEAAAEKPAEKKEEAPKAEEKKKEPKPNAPKPEEKKEEPKPAEAPKKEAKPEEKK